MSSLLVGCDYDGMIVDSETKPSDLNSSCPDLSGNISETFVDELAQAKWDITTPIEPKAAQYQTSVSE